MEAAAAALAAVAARSRGHGGDGGVATGGGSRQHKRSFVRSMKLRLVLIGVPPSLICSREGSKI